MKTRLGKIGLVLAVLTVCLAGLGVGYGLWSQTLNISGTVNTGNINLVFVDDPGTGGVRVSPFTNDDNVVNDVLVDPTDVGWCPLPQLYDDDGDGSVNEDGWSGAYPLGDGLPGADDDGDGLVDEDPTGKLTTCDPLTACSWDVPTESWVCPTTGFGADIGTTTAVVDFTGKTLEVSLANAAVGLGGGYSPTVYFDLTNTGTVAVVVADISLDLSAAWDLWDRNGDSTIVDIDNDGVCDLGDGDECALALMPELSGIAFGDYIDPGALLPGTLKLTMTQASQPGRNYGVSVSVTGHNWNEPSP